METALKKKLIDWLSQNQMKIKTSKSQLPVLGTRAMLHDVPQISIKVGNFMVTESRVVKNIYLVLDRHLSFKPHIHQLTAKCTYMLIALMHAQ